jgi:hypothetical protein
VRVIINEKKLEFEKNGITKRVGVNGSVYIERAGVYIYIVGANVGM